MAEVLSWKTSELSFLLAKDGGECLLHVSSLFLHVACWAVAVAASTFNVELCPYFGAMPRYKTFQWLLPSAQNTWESIWGLKWMVVSSNCLAHLSPCECPGLAKGDPIPTIA